MTFRLNLTWSSELFDSDKVKRKEFDESNKENGKSLNLSEIVRLYSWMYLDFVNILLQKEGKQ